MRKAKRAVFVAARVKTKKSLSSMALPAEVTAVPEKDICSAIVTMVKRGHVGASRSKWPEIAQKITDKPKVNTNAPEKDICSAIVTIVKKGHAGASRSK